MRERSATIRRRSEFSSERRHGHSEPLPEIIRLRLVAAGIVLGILVLSIYGFTSGNRYVLLGLAALPVMILLINRSRWWVLLAVGASGSWLYVPGFPTALSLFNTLVIGLVPVMIAQRCLHRERSLGTGYTGALLAALGAVAFVTMAHRGFSLRFLGGDVWGAATYLHLFVVIVFFIACNHVTLSKRQCRIMLILYLGGAILPALAEGVYLLSRGSIYHFYYLIRPDGSSLHSSLAAVEGAGGLMRFQVSRELVTLFVLALALFPMRGRGIAVICAAGTLSAAAAGISGHRGAIFYIVLLIPVVVWLSNPRWLPIIILSSLAAATVSVVFLHLIVQDLPLSFQRAVSWVPFVDVSSEARWSADVTVAWRFRLWERVLEHLDEYWLIGRGVTFVARDLGSVWTMGPQNIEMAYLTHNYHSGPLSLLIDFGIFGLVIGSTFLVYVVVRHLRLRSRSWSSPNLERGHRVLLAAYIVRVVSFYVILGDIDRHLIGLIVHVVVLELLVRSDHAQGLADEANPQATGAIA